VHAIDVDHGIDGGDGLIAPAGQLFIEPMHELTDRLMAQRATEDLLGQLGCVPGTGSHEVGMAQDPFDIDQSALVAFEDQ
jgi:hypothetical protein